MAAYYNEHDPKAAAWLRELIAAGLIAPGDVDTRSITEIKPHELTGYTQHHFFAGIGGWPYALRLAGWPDDRPVKTGSCPCQPFSQAGRGKGEQDERHLWPVFRDIIALCEPSVTFGEQVASAAGRVWLARVRADLESLGYGVGAADLCAPSVGAPHIRQRLFWVADPDGRKSGNGRIQRGRKHGLESEDRGSGRMADDDTNRRQAGSGDERPEASARIQQRNDIERCGNAGGMDDTDGNGAKRTRLAEQVSQSRCEAGGMADTRHESARGSARPCEAEGGRAFSDASRCCDACGMEHAEGNGREQRRPESSGGGVTCGRRPSFWSDFDLLPCTDGKSRRIEPGSFPLAHGVPGRVGLLRGYGNAIVPQVAAEFIKAFVEA